MKIVTYNVNGLRPRVAQFGSLSKLLNSLDADVICFQETKLRRPELTADLVMAEGYESFFSCMRTSDRIRAGYSGVATFCRVKSAFASEEAALPVAAEEGFSCLIGDGRGEYPAEGLEEFSRDELLEIDGEGRCIITDHHHFVLFNLYGPSARHEDTERNEFKLKFNKMLQKRWESLLHQGRRIIVVGDLNIAPTCLDRCDAGPEFEDNQFRRWFRSLLVENGGAFYDVFRAKHPNRREAYTFWSQSSGAEEFNYGSRIDHILCSGVCLHQQQDLENHSLVACHVDECDIITQFKRWKPGNSLRCTDRWNGGQRTKLEGSDHAPVYTSLLEIPNIYKHSTPRLSTRYIPMVRGLQQTLVSVLMKRKAAEQVEPDGNNNKENSSESERISSDQCGTPCSSRSQDSEILNSKPTKCRSGFANGASCTTLATLSSDPIKTKPANETKKKAKRNRGSQLSLKSFFQKSLIRNPSSGADNDTGVPSSQIHAPASNHFSETPLEENQNSGLEQCESKSSASIQDQDQDELSACPSKREKNSSETPVEEIQNSGLEQCELNSSASIRDQDQDELKACSSKKEKNSIAILEWQRVQKVMQDSIPFCKGHKEPCVSRVVKKEGPNFGRKFYVCGRAEGPASNPEANCNYFKWAGSKPRNNRR